MRRISTLKDLLLATTELLTVVTSHAQYLSDRGDMPGDCRKDVDIIILEAKLIAGHLAMVPPHLGQAVIRDPEGDPETASGAQDG
jgi:hypothetical protein